MRKTIADLKQDFMSLIPGNKLVSGGLMLNSFMTCIKVSQLCLLMQLIIYAINYAIMLYA